MASIALRKRWRIVTTLLKRAQHALPRRDGPEYIAKEEEFEEYILHNELGLALEVLEELAELVSCRGGFWRDMERAAIIMELDDHAKRFRARFLATRSDSI